MFKECCSCALQFNHHYMNYNIFASFCTTEHICQWTRIYICSRPEAHHPHKSSEEKQLQGPRLEDFHRCSCKYQGGLGRWTTMDYMENAEASSSICTISGITLVWIRKVTWTFPQIPQPFGQVLFFSPRCLAMRDAHSWRCCQSRAAPPISRADP